MRLRRWRTIEPSWVVAVVEILGRQSRRQSLVLGVLSSCP